MKRTAKNQGKPKTNKKKQTNTQRKQAHIHNSLNIKKNKEKQIKTKKKGTIKVCMV